MRIHDTKPLTDYLKKHSISDFMSCKPMQFKVPILGYKGISKDAMENSFWEIDASDFNNVVMQEFNKGNIIINHMIHSSVSLLMSKDTFEKYLYLPSTVVFSDFMDYFKVQQEIAKKYFERSKTVKATGKLAPGYIYSTGVADGSAYYLVTKVTKASVFLEHLHFGDGYRCQHIDAFNGKVPLAYFNKISYFGRSNFLA